MKFASIPGFVCLVSLFTGSVAIDPALAHDGEQTSETRDLKTFDKIVLDGSADVNITVGDPQKVEIQTDSGYLDLIKTEVKNHTLYISQERHHWRGTNVLFEISVANLTGITIDGSGDFDIRNVDSDTFDIEIDGSGDVYLSGKSDSFGVEIDGSGDVILEGGCNSLVVEVDGSGDIDTRSLTCKSADVTVEGSGDVDVFASDVAIVDMSGSGDVTIYGNPDRLRPRVSGSGTFKVIEEN